MMPPDGESALGAGEAVLLGYQRRWIADPAQVKVCEKSRRIGLTWAEACDDVVAAAAEQGEDTWYVGYNKEMALEFVETAAQWARALDAAAREIEELALADEERHILAYRIRFASGFKLTALSSRPSNLRGKQGRVVIDEAAFHDDLPGLMKAAMALTMWGGKVRVISTHNGAGNAFNDLVAGIRAGRKPYALHRATIDDALADGLYQRICRRLKRAWNAEAEAEWRRQLFADYGDDAAEELLCVPRAGGGAFLSTALVENRMRAGVPVLRWEAATDFDSRSDHDRRCEAAAWCEANLSGPLDALDRNLRHCFGEDFGRSGDLTVIWPLAIGQDLVRRTPFAVELRNIPFKQQEQVLFHIADRLPRLCAGALDAGGNGAYLAETAAQRYGGGRIAQVRFSIEWYRSNMPRYKAAFEDGAIELPRDADILADHRALVMENGVAHPREQRERGGDGKPRHADSAIAAALAYCASLMDVREYAYEAAPRNPAGFEPRSDELVERPDHRGDSDLRVRAAGGFGPGAW